MRDDGDAALMVRTNVLSESSVSSFTKIHERDRLDEAGKPDLKPRFLEYLDRGSHMDPDTLPGMSVEKAWELMSLRYPDLAQVTTLALTAGVTMAEVARQIGVSRQEAYKRYTLAKKKWIAWVNGDPSDPDPLYDLKVHILGYEPGSP